ncbi:MAG: hypothetical protein PF441_07840 [Desulfuromusa sp.]|nr:hypothetical protein [Desulfuromusa sp.]
MRKEVKKFIIYVIFVFVTGFSAFFIYGSMQSSQYDGTAVPYIMETLPKISTWDPEIVKQLMAPEVLKTVSAENLANILAALADIGELQSIGDATFKNKSTDGTGGNVQLINEPVITYEVEAQYSTGDAKVIISMIDRGGSYEIYHFNFKSKALFQ